MIDLSALESEIAGLIATAMPSSFKSSSVGRIREELSNSEMPALDLAAGVPEITTRAGYESYRCPVTIVIRAQGFKRTTAEERLKTLLEGVVSALQLQKGTTFDVVRNITGRTADDPGGSGATVRVGVITLTALKN